MFQSFLQGWVELDYWSDKTPNPVNDINNEVNHLMELINQNG